MLYSEFKNAGEYGAAGMFEEQGRSLFYRKSLGLRRYYENCSLMEYNGELLYPSGAISKKMCVCPSYLEGMSINYNQMAKKDKTLADLFSADFCKYSSSVPKEHTVGGDMWTHSIPNYERVLKEGLLSYIPRVEKIKDVDLKEGLLNVIEGIKVYINRCVDYLKEQNADKLLTDALSKVPLFPAENIFEAIIAWNFILYLDNCDGLGCLASGLYPYYKGEDILPYLDNLYNNVDANNGWSMALGTDYNELTILCLEASKGKRRPMVELLVNDNTPDRVWEKAFEVIRTNNGQPAFYNEKVILNGLKEKFSFIRDKDLKKFCGGGCTETMLAGLSNVGSVDAGINLLLIFEEVLYNKLTKVKTFDEFYLTYISEVEKVIENVTEKISESQIKRAKYNPLPMRTLLMDDCIDKGLDFNNGGARYKWSIISFAGLINVLDSMLVIKDMVFDDKLITGEKLLELLNLNDREFLNNVKEHKTSFGTDNPVANEFAGKLSRDIYAFLDNKKPYFGEGFLPASIQFKSQVEAGRKIKATPDGRESGAPLCDSIAAIFGKDTKGPTALLKSVTALDLKSALGIPVLNFNISPEFDNSVFKALVLGYMDEGGIHMQITCTSLKNLLEAYENPELHKNLIVRVGGYSEYFNRLSDDVKRMIINRTIQKIN